MAIYEKNIGGAWVNAETVKDGAGARFVSEVDRKESRFKDDEGNAKIENVGKIRIDGQNAPLNIRVNWTSIGGLIDAFGADSKEWIGKELTITKKEMLVGDTMRDVLYLVPEGYSLVKNEEKKLEIRRVEEV